MLSVLEWSWICTVLLIIKYVFLQPLEDKKLFKLYAARDNVALAAIKGEISQDEEVYQFVIDKINFAIYYTKHNYDFSIVLKNIFIRPEEVQKHLKEMYELVKQKDFLEKNFNISIISLSKDLNIKLFILIYFIIYPCLIFFKVILKIINSLLTIKISSTDLKLLTVLKNRITTLSNIHNDYAVYKQSELNHLRL